MTPALKHRCTHWLRTTDAWELGRQVALTCLDPDDVTFEDEDEHQAFWRGWRETKRLMEAEAAVAQGRIADAERELDAADEQPPSGWWAWALWVIGVRP